MANLRYEEGFAGFTFGCDPELVIVNQNGEPVGAEGLVPGTKENPHKVEKGAVQVDGMAAEINIDPVTTRHDWIDNIATVRKQLDEMLPEGYKSIIASSMSYSKENWEAVSKENRVMGCSPDYNAWTGDINRPPKLNPNSRTWPFGGHIHIGWIHNNEAPLNDSEHLENCRDLIKQLDWFVGAWSVQTETDMYRRSLYGKAGAFRYTSYGVEYRTPSSLWLRDSRAIGLMWDRMQAALHYMAKTFFPEAAPHNWNEVVRAVINENEKVEHDYGPLQFPVVSLNSKKQVIL